MRVSRCSHAPKRRPTFDCLEDRLVLTAPFAIGGDPIVHPADFRITTFAQGLNYPQTKKVDHVDTYHGVKVADPYRWLEDDNSPETAKWVEEQNKVTFAYLEKIPYRAKSRIGVLILSSSIARRSCVKF